MVSHEVPPREGSSAGPSSSLRKSNSNLVKSELDKLAHPSDLVTEVGPPLTRWVTPENRLLGDSLWGSQFPTGLDGTGRDSKGRRWYRSVSVRVESNRLLRSAQFIGMNQCAICSSSASVLILVKRDLAGNAR